MNLSLIHDAITFATKAHEGQIRKTTDVPYISHPYTAALYAQPFINEAALSNKEKTNIIIAIILHDVLEDTETTSIQLENRFGKEITQLVIGASEADKSKTWKERKSDTIIKTKGVSLPLKYVICADKVHNLHSMLESKQKLGENVWDSFKAGKEEQNWYFSSLYESLIDGLTPVPSFFKEMKHYIDEIF